MLVEHEAFPPQLFGQLHLLENLLVVNVIRWIQIGEVGRENVNVEAHSIESLANRMDYQSIDFESGFATAQSFLVFVLVSIPVMPLFYFLYSCLMNPDASISCTKLGSTNDFGSADAAFGLRGAISSSKVFIPVGSAYGTSNRTEV